MNDKVRDHPSVERKIEMSRIVGKWIVHIVPRGPHADLSRWFDDATLEDAASYAAELAQANQWPILVRYIENNGPPPSP